LPLQVFGDLISVVLKNNDTEALVTFKRRATAEKVCCRPVGRRVFFLPVPASPLSSPPHNLSHQALVKPLPFNDRCLQAEWYDPFSQQEQQRQQEYLQQLQQQTTGSQEEEGGAQYGEDANMSGEAEQPYEGEAGDVDAADSSFIAVNRDSSP
jgi:hypothetical protein